MGHTLSHQVSPAVDRTATSAEMQRRGAHAADRFLCPDLVACCPLVHRYEDGDDEHLTLKQMRRHLVDPEGCQQRLEAALAAEDENDENQQAPGDGPAPKRQRAGGVLGDATDRSRNAAPAAGEERRSRWVLGTLGGGALDCNTCWEGMPGGLYALLLSSPLQSLWPCMSHARCTYPKTCQTGGEAAAR